MGNDIVTEINALRGLKVPALVERYTDLFGEDPRSKQVAWLRKRIAWKLQEQRHGQGHGGLSPAAQGRLEQLIAQVQGRLPLPARPAGGNVRRKGAGRVAPGTVLVRMWRGEEIRVQLLEKGVEYEGVVYRSLSAVAKVVTGAHWNGKFFFGLTPRKAAQR